jgi:para-nitrobenzyl esterase
MVWLPGGGFTTGGTAPPTYDPRPLSAQGDVVVVAVNYRLGIVGFSALGPVANLGLRDQLAALEWVQRHIADFGGDPGCVTVFGESAGGGSIMHLLSSPLRAGLFHRAIVQSGATDLTLSKTQAERVADRLRAALGGADLAGTGIDDLLAVQADTITGLVAEVGGLPFHPWVDGDVVSDRPLNALRDGCAAGVPLLIGTTTDELRLFVDTAEQGLTDDRLRHRLVRYLAARGRSDDATVDRILSAHATDQPSLTTAECWAAIRTEAEMRAPMVAAAEAQSAHAPTFVYEFTWPAIGAFARLGACHALDLPFTFGTVGVDGWPACVGRGPAPAKVSAALRAAWVSFATTGDPSHEAIGAWPAYEPVRRTTMELGRQRQIHDDPRAATRRAWAATRTSD